MTQGPASGIAPALTDPLDDRNKGANRENVMSSDTLLDERETITERGGDDEQVVRKLIAGGLLRRRRLRRLLLVRLLRERQ